jgi:proline iminopeptidase
VNHENYAIAEDGVRLFYQERGTGAKKLVIPNGIYLLDDFQRLADERTLIVYDPRNRGRSDSVPGDIHRDVDDLEAVRRHFGIERLDLIGHSYMGLMVALYAMKFPAPVNRIVQIGPMQYEAGKQYPAHLTNNDATVARVFSRLGQMRNEAKSKDPQEFCRQVSAVLSELCVADPADAGKIDWGRCELPNELNFMKYWTGILLPSIQGLRLTAKQISKVTNPVLTIHGRKDRNAPYGSGREWALMLPEARLVTIDEGAHAPWIEAPEKMFGAVGEFFDGRWPAAAEKVASV